MSALPRKSPHALLTIAVTCAHQVGRDVPTRLLGTLAFAFAPHGEYAYTDATATQPVPEGISAAGDCNPPAIRLMISTLSVLLTRVCACAANCCNRRDLPARGGDCNLSRA